MKSLIATVFTGALLLAGPAHAGGLSNNLMLSSAWCTFKYNKTSGSSSSRRMTFNQNGTYSVSSRAESGSSGKAGSTASESSASGGGQWKVQGGELYMSEGGPLEHVATVLKRNNNGYPIIIAEGVEYSQCR